MAVLNRAISRFVGTVKSLHEDWQSDFPITVIVSSNDRYSVHYSNFDKVKVASLQIKEIKQFHKLRLDSRREDKRYENKTT